MHILAISTLVFVSFALPIAPTTHASGVSSFCSDHPPSASPNIRSLGPTLHSCPSSTTLSFSQKSKLLASDGAGGNHFSIDDGVDISNGIAVVGSKFGAGNEYASGAAYIFERDVSGSWAGTTKLIAADGKGGSHFGVSVSISDCSVVIGASTGGYCDPTIAADILSLEMCSGSAYVFAYTGGTWIEESKLIAPDGHVGNYFGSVWSTYLRITLSLVLSEIMSWDQMPEQLIYMSEMH